MRWSLSRDKTSLLSPTPDPSGCTSIQVPPRVAKLQPTLRTFSLPVQTALSRVCGRLWGFNAVL